MKTVSIEVYTAAELQEHFPKAFIKAKANFLEHHENMEASNIYKSFEACMEYFGIKFKKFPHYSSFFICCEIPEDFDYAKSLNYVIGEGFPFTGMYYDNDMVEFLRKNVVSKKLVKSVYLSESIKAFESLGEYVANLITRSDELHCSDEYFIDFAENNLFFDKNGNIIND